MRIALGTIELSDETLRAIRREGGKRGRATRADAKDWAHELIGREIERLTGEPVPDVTDVDADVDDVDDDVDDVGDVDDTDVDDDEGPNITPPAPEPRDDEDTTADHVAANA